MEKVALITGIRRVGKKVAESLLEKGYNLAAVYRSSEKEVLQLEETAKKVGRDLMGLRADLCDERSWEDLVEKTFERFGRIDAFVHLASPYKRTPLQKLSPSDVREHFFPIAEAFLFISKFAYEKMIYNEGSVKGRIVAFGDWAVEYTPYRDYSAYFLAKGALHTAVKVLAKEFAPHVLVNCVALGPTLRAEELSEKEWSRILSRTPLRREVSIEDVLSITDFLLRTESITGEIIKLDSGRHLAGSGVGSVA